MRHLLALLLASVLTGCIFETRVITSPSVEIDENLIGTWRNERRPEGRLRVVRASSKDYFVTAPSTLAIATEIKLNSKRIIQIEMIEERGSLNLVELIHYFKIETSNDKLYISMINLDYFGRDPSKASKEELIEAMSLDPEPKRLFGPPDTFVRETEDTPKELDSYARAYLGLIRKSRDGSAPTGSEYENALKNPETLLDIINN